MEEALTARLLAVVVLTQHYGTRMFFQTRPADANSLPALTFQIVGDPREYNHDAPDGMQEARIQFDSRGRTYKEAKQGLRKVLSEMELEKKVGDILFHEGRKVSGSDAPKETLAGGTEVFRITMDVMVPFSAVAN